MNYICADTGNYSYIVQCSGWGGEFRQYLADSCADFYCGDGALCDNTLNDGDFSPTNVCSSGSCNGVIPDELVDANFDGSCEFKAGGCNSDCNGCLCSVDGDTIPDGICVDEECIVNAPIVLDCGDSCDTSDIISSAFITCDGNEGKACSVSAVGGMGGSTYFTQTGICGENTMNGSWPSSCFFYIEVCQHNGKYYNGCGFCSEGDPCDDDGGNFDPNYGTCMSGICSPNNCAEERVDINQDGTFIKCGCNFNDGIVCDTNGDSVADGLCVNDTCVTSGPISMECFGNCVPGSFYNIHQGCGIGGYACDNDYITSG